MAALLPSVVHFKPILVVGCIMFQLSSSGCSATSKAHAHCQVKEAQAFDDAEQWSSAEESGVHLLQKSSQAIEGLIHSPTMEKPAIEGSELDPGQEVEQSETKTECEMKYWNIMQKKEGDLANEHYLKDGWYTSAFGLTKEWYDGKHMLDVGCGPRGSLQWADNAASRTCIDPLALEYGKHMGVGKKHDMRYVYAGVESIPFPDESFDVVTSINNFDHVARMDAGMKELVRVLRPGGSLIMIVEIHAKPTRCEPQVLPWSLAEDFEKMGMNLKKKWATEAIGKHISGSTNAIYNEAYNFSRPVAEHDGYLSFHMIKSE